MNPYHKINTLFKRDMEQKKHPIIIGDYSTPELAYLAENQWEFTEKVDGTNIRIKFDGENVTYGGRTERASIPATLVNSLNDMFLPLAPVLKEKFPGGCCLYGEGYGKKIQKVGHLYSDTQTFVVFDIKVGPWWLLRSAVEEICSDLGLPIVPVIGHGTLADAIDLVKAGLQSQWGAFEAEGIVARPAVPMFTRSGERIITKIKARDFK